MRYKNPQLVAQHCFLACFGWYFPFFTLHDQLVAQRNICCGLQKYSAGLIWATNFGFVARFSSTLHLVMQQICSCCGASWRFLYLVFRHLNLKELGGRGDYGILVHIKCPEVLIIVSSLARALYCVSGKIWPLRDCITQMYTRSLLQVLVFAKILVAMKRMAMLIYHLTGKFTQCITYMLC